LPRKTGPQAGGEYRPGILSRATGEFTRADGGSNREPRPAHRIPRPSIVQSLTTSAVHQSVRRTIRRYNLCPPGTRLLVGLSGGSDSVALTLLLRDLSEHGQFSVVGLAHVDHQLRTSAGRDVQFCRDLATRLSLPVTVESVDVRGYAAANRLSLEDAARRMRYDVLERAARAEGADRIAVGHTQDDQAETLLMKLVRGAGPTGLAGVYPRRGRVVRPLLEVSRADLRAMLVTRGETWVEDETNQDVANPRNRMRHRVLDELERLEGAPVRAAVARAATLIREDAEWLDELGEQQFMHLVAYTPAGVVFDAADLGAVPAPVRRRVLLRALRQVAGEREVGFEHVHAALEVLSGAAAAADVPGGRVELRAGKLVLIQQGTSPR
jgi:tRNA(Ile)-lysidine synthase